MSNHNMSNMTGVGGSYDVANFAIDAGAEVRRLNAQLDLFWEPELALHKNLGLQDGLRVLDCGCGPGHLLQKLARVFPKSQFTGIDVDPMLIEIATETSSREGMANCAFSRQSVLEMEFPDESFDYVVMRLVLEHLPEPARALREVLRVLRNGGTAVFIDNDFDFHERTWPDSPALADYYEAYRQARRADGGNPCIGRQLPVLLRQAGYTQVGLDILSAHSQLLGDEAFLKASGAGIPAQLVKTGYLDAEALQRLTEQWAAMLGTDGHSVFRMLFAASGKKSGFPPSLEEHAGSTEKGNGSRSHDEGSVGPQPLVSSNVQRLIREVLETEMELPSGSILLDEPLIGAGVDSLAALRLCNRLNTDFGVTMKIADVISGKSIKELAADVLLQIEKKQTASPGTIPIQPRHG